MRKKRHIFTAVTAAAALASAVLLFPGAGAVSAADGRTDPGGACSLRVRYMDTAEGEGGTEAPVTGAGFTLYRIADVGDTGSLCTPLIEGLELDAGTEGTDVWDAAVRAYGDGHMPAGGAVREAVTDAEGNAWFRDLAAGVYLVGETSPAQAHFASVPFLVMLPGTAADGTALVYERTAEPKPLPAGTLEVRKTVAGNAGERDRDFHFTVAFDGKNASLQPESWHYTKSDGTEGTIRSGGAVTLRDGQTVRFDMIPVGTGYTVTETESGQDGYHTQASGAKGVIRRVKAAQAVFTNTKDLPAAGKTNVQTGDAIWLPAGVLLLLVLGSLVRAARRRSHHKGGER